LPYIPVTIVKVNDAEGWCRPKHGSNIGSKSVVLSSVKGRGLMYRPDNGSKREGVVLRIVVWKFVSPAL
jgi:hypothetical protein